MFRYWILLAVTDFHVLKSKTDEIEKRYPVIELPLYQCLDSGTCEPLIFGQVVAENDSSTIFDSQHLCETVCCRFGNLWPRPMSANFSMQTVKIHPNYLRYDLSSVPTEARTIIDKMTQLASNILLLECDGNITDFTAMSVDVYITVLTSKLELTWDTNEEYSLDIEKNDNGIAVHIESESLYGARHALETFTQLVISDKPDINLRPQCGLRIFVGVKIKDKPAYKHRGLVLDTSRHFIPKTHIKRTIDGMSACKMNIFHWHITDSQSFPMESRRVPQFTRYGAYSASEIYSTEDISDIINYAQIRGVRVIIEIDAPAHAGNGWQWGRDYGFGDLAVCLNAARWQQLCVQTPCGQLNPANDVMYRVLRNLYRDVAELLPKPQIFHMGGDEVFFSCWNSSKSIVKYMKRNGFSRTRDGFIKLWAEFHTNALKIWDEELAALGVRFSQPVMVWSSELTKPHHIQEYLRKDRYVIEVWDSIKSPVLKALLKLGYKTVSAPRNVWYLDHGFWEGTKYSSWKRMYGHRLPKDSNMLGGEVAMWTEYVDEQNLDLRVWPRAAAVAERLWSDPSTPASTAELRLQRQRARLVDRGLRPGTMSPAFCLHPYIYYHYAVVSLVGF